MNVLQQKCRYYFLDAVNSKFLRTFLCFEQNKYALQDYVCM